MCNDDLGFLVPFFVDHFIEGDPTIEMNVTLRLPSSSKAINNGPPLFHLTALLLRLPKLRHTGEVFSLHSERLVMSSSSSSSFSSSSLSSPSFSSDSSTIEPLLVGSI